MNQGPEREAAAAATWRLWIAPLVWAAHFLAIYAFTALACARKGTTGWFGVGTVPWVVGGATLLAATILAAMIMVSIRSATRATAAFRNSPFVDWLAAATSALVLLAILWETLPLLWVPACE